MRKNAPLVQVKAGPADGLDEGQFTGYASVFGNKDSYGDVVQPGAFKDTLAEWDASGDKLPVLWGHDMSDPFSNIGYVTQAAEDDHGLKVTAQLDLENPKSAQVYRLLKNRQVAQMSFAYDVLEGGPRTEGGQEFYSLDKLKLYEVSIVPIGANQETEILAVKAAEEWDATATALRTLAAKAGRALSAKTETAARAALDSAQETVTQLKNVLAVLDDAKAEDQEKARTDAPANDEEPERAKSEEPARTVPAERLARQQKYLALIEGERGSL